MKPRTSENSTVMLAHLAAELQLLGIGAPAARPGRATDTGRKRRGSGAVAARRACSCSRRRRRARPASSRRREGGIDQQCDGIERPDRHREPMAASTATAAKKHGPQPEPRHEPDDQQADHGDEDDLHADRVVRPRRELLRQDVFQIWAWISTPGIGGSSGVSRKSSSPTAEVPISTMCPAMLWGFASPAARCPPTRIGRGGGVEPGPDLAAAVGRHEDAADDDAGQPGVVGAGGERLRRR